MNRYTYKRAVISTNGVTLWYCSSRSNGCLAAVKSSGEEFRECGGLHNHNPPCYHLKAILIPTNKKHPLLMYERYTFKYQIKLASGKIIWYCSQRLKGCKATMSSINGTYLKPDVRHNHDPPNYYQSSKGTWLKLISERGKKHLIVDGYSFICRSYCLNHIKKNWKCASHAGCTAKVHTVDGEIVNVNNVHNHPSLATGQYDLDVANYAFNIYHYNHIHLGHIVNVVSTDVHPIESDDDVIEVMRDEAPIVILSDDEEMNILPPNEYYLEHGSNTAQNASDDQFDVFTDPLKIPMYVENICENNLVLNDTPPNFIPTNKDKAISDYVESSNLKATCCIPTNVQTPPTGEEPQTTLEENKLTVESTKSSDIGKFSLSSDTMISTNYQPLDSTPALKIADKSSDNKEEEKIEADNKIEKSPILIELEKPTATCNVETSSSNDKLTNFDGINEKCSIGNYFTSSANSQPLEEGVSLLIERNGRRVLFIGRHRYLKHYDGPGGRTRWRCCRSFSRCRAIAFTVENRLIKLTDVHNH
ncbi:hypothetical protein EVAR_9206_1 [Eumeta japonica]|uniref:FLYWCH-type domain-containing protein n=1 Tax=Eumeta variegata TaxID=151549 RepID=A0A4C1WQB3_EUMVA|nr:hypothetical protein EVAR_9206_1 [Eumeta japonica]